MKYLLNELMRRDLHQPTVDGNADHDLSLPLLFSEEYLETWRVEGEAQLDTLVRRLNGIEPNHLERVFDLLVARERAARLRGELLAFNSLEQIVEYLNEIDWDEVDSRNEPEPAHNWGDLERISLKNDFRLDEDDFLRLPFTDDQGRQLSPTEVHQFRLLFRQLSRLSEEQLEAAFSRLSTTNGHRVEYLVRLLSRFDLHRPTVSGNADQDERLQSLFSEDYFARTSFLSDLRFDVIFSQLSRLEGEVKRVVGSLAGLQGSIEQAEDFLRLHELVEPKPGTQPGVVESWGGTIGKGEYADMEFSRPTGRYPPIDGLLFDRQAWQGAWQLLHKEDRAPEVDFDELVVYVDSKDANDRNSRGVSFYCDEEQQIHPSIIMTLVAYPPSENVVFDIYLVPRHCPVAEG